MTQNDMVLAYIDKFGSITQREALNVLGVARLASRVNDLRKAGHPIISEVVTGQNRFGEKTRWARYRMGVR